MLSASLFQPQASFIAEASFIDAPLNSRVSASPRKTASSRPAKPLIPRSADEYKSLTSTRLRQIIMNSEAEVDDEADLKLYDEHVPDDGEGKGKQREDLGDADIQIQEALLIEDLLSVLMVRDLAISCGAAEFTHWPSIPRASNRNTSLLPRPTTHKTLSPASAERASAWTSILTRPFATSSTAYFRSRGITPR